MYIETIYEIEPTCDFVRVNEDPVSQEWNGMMATLQERVLEAGPDEWRAPMEQVFDLSG